MKTRLFVAVCLASLSVCGEVRNWGGSTGGDWFEPANWAEAAFPVAGDTVVVGSGSVLLTNATPALASFTITNATLTATNWTTVLTASAVVIRNGGVLTHASCATNAVPGNTNRIHIVCDDLMIDVGGKIDVIGRGFAGGSQPAGRLIGQGPGGGRAHVTHAAGGGSYGGIGGRGNISGALPGPIYGVPEDPFEPGSGGGAGSHASYPGSVGGWGGGTVRIEAAGKVTVNGQILADGLKVSTVWGSGGGSGGGVYVACDTIEGAGLLSANGSDRQSEGGGGGGGRIAMHYNAAAQQALAEQPTLKFTVNASINHGNATPADNQYGTVYLTDDTFLPQAVAAMFQTRTHLYGVTNWAPARIGVTNTALFFREPAVTVAVAEDIAIGAAGALDFTLADTALTVGGGVSIQGGGFMRLRSGPTNGVTAYGGLAAVAGDLAIGNASILYLNSDATNGGAVKLTVDNLNVLSGAQVNANGGGFASGLSAASPHGVGPGRGFRGANSGGGGGHGGTGGRGGHSDSTGGVANGDPANPTVPGSGGGDYRATNEGRGAGGGVVWIEAATAMLIDGTITANGLSPSSYTGGGAGGGILLKAPLFKRTLTGVIRANGGNGGAESGGGGGGRIARVGWMTDLFDGTFSVNGGTAGNASSFAGGTGTVYRAADGAYDHTLHVAGVPLRHGETVPYDYGMHGFTDGAPVTIDAPLLAEETSAHRYYLLGYTLTNSAGIVAESTATQAVFTVEGDLWLNWNWTNQWYLATSSGDNGSLVADRSGWYTNAVSVTVEAVADPDYAFLQWAGVGVPLGQEGVNPITLSMTQARDIQAVFVSMLPVDRVWNGSGTWLTAGNWTPSGIPGPNDNVTIRSGTVIVTDPVTVGSVVVSNNATVTFTNWTTRLTAGDITVLSNATMTHAASRIANDPGNTNRIHLICENLTVMTGGKIDVTSKGYGGGVAAAGEGPGGGKTTANSGAGGGYGGVGGITQHGAAGGVTYGTVASPNELGSGGGGRISGTLTGGAGGGLVRVEATGVVTVDGQILANGQNGQSGNSGGGSGGGIAIHCLRLAGGGLLSARGGLKSSEGGAGAGGRIAVAYDTAAQAAQTPSARVRYTTTSSVNHNRPLLLTQAGSVYLTDDAILPNALGDVLLHTNYLHNVTQLVRSDLTVSNTYVVLTPNPGFRLATTGNLTLVNNGSLDINMLNEPLEVGGDLAVSGGASILTVRGGPTNGVNQAYGTRVGVAGTLRVGSGGAVISHADATNGAAIKFEVNELVVDAGGTVQADGLGFRSRTTSNSRGLGVDEGLNKGGGGYGRFSGGGGGHGGRGGRGNSTHGANHGGYTYASSNQAPVYVGSAGGSGNTAGGGGRGGGLVWVEAAGRIRVDGTVSANGGTSGSAGGGGSGGGIWLICRRFEGAGGLLRVNGGAASGSEGGGGGGGRILVFRTTDTSSGIQTSMLGGSKVHGSASPGEPGTAAFIDLPASGTLLLLR